MYTKKLFVKALLSPLLLLFIACSHGEEGITALEHPVGHNGQNNPDENNSAGVTGTWKAVNYIYDGELFAITDVCQQEILEINTDGSAVSTKYCPGGNFVTAYTWTHNGTDIYGFDSEETYFPVTYHLTFPEGNDTMYSVYTEPQPHSFTKIYVRM